MTTQLTPPVQEAVEPSQNLTPVKVVILAVFATFVWFCAALYIRFGSLSDFTGKGGEISYLETVLATVPLNFVTRKIVGLPRKQMLTAVAVTAATATMLDGIAMSHFPELYGNDPARIAAGGSWLLWAIGVALTLALITSTRAHSRLEAGNQAPTIVAQNVLGQEVCVPDPAIRFTHVQFLRFANCPVCNLLLQDFIKRIGEVHQAGVREVVFFHSEAKLLREHQGQFPFDVIADPQRIFYRKYKVERSPSAILSPRAWRNLINGYRLRSSGIPDTTPFGLPADFLIDRDGKIIACHYGQHSSDQWSVDALLKIVKEQNELKSFASI